MKNYICTNNYYTNSLNAKLNLFKTSSNQWYSSSFNGEHATTINGEGKNPTPEDVLAVAKNIGIKENKTKEIVLDIKDKCLSLFD